MVNQDLLNHLGMSATQYAPEVSGLLRAKLLMPDIIRYHLDKQRGIRKINAQIKLVFPKRRENLMILLFLTAIGLAIGVARAYKYKSDKAVFYERLLLPVIFVSVGINGILFGFIPHVFFSDMIAGQIGWAKGNPFQLEVGYHDGCWGVIGLLSAWFKGGFALAAGIGWALFLLLAGWGHLRETIVNHNYAPYNFQFIAGDIIPAILLLVLSSLYYKHSCKRG